MTFGTTLLFLEYFGLRDLDELPAADELRRIVVEKPEALLTIDPGLATTPPDPAGPETSTESPATEPAQASSDTGEAPENAPAETSDLEPAP